MGKIRSLNDCSTGKDFKTWVEHHPKTREIRETGSSHMCAKGPNPGTAVIPVHNKDLPIGTKKSVIRMLIAIGLGVMSAVAYFL